MSALPTTDTPAMGSCVSEVKAHAGAKYFCGLVERQRATLPDELRILVAGCGHGKEAAYIHDRLGARVEAIDQWLTRGIELPERERLHFQEADVLDLPFEDGAFDIVFYHHVIEHVSAPARSIAELARVLAPGGRMFVGTPNRHRIIGGVGAYERSFRHKVRKNIHDFKMRLKGKFRNEYGAHAGFSRAELDGMLEPFFVRRDWVTREYLLFKYNRGMRSICARIATLGLCKEIVVPSIYAWCFKKSN